MLRGAKKKIENVFILIYIISNQIPKQIGSKKMYKYRCMAYVCDKTKKRTRRCLNKFTYTIGSCNYCYIHYKRNVESKVITIQKYTRAYLRFKHSNATIIQTLIRGYLKHKIYKFYKKTHDDIKEKIKFTLHDELQTNKLNIQLSKYIFRKLDNYFTLLEEPFTSISSSLMFRHINNFAKLQYALKLLIWADKYKKLLLYNSNYTKSNYLYWFNPKKENLLSFKIRDDVNHSFTVKVSVYILVDRLLNVVKHICSKIENVLRLNLNLTSNIDIDLLCKQLAYFNIDLIIKTDHTYPGWGRFLLIIGNTVGITHVDM